MTIPGKTFALFLLGLIMKTYGSKNTPIHTEAIHTEEIFLWKG